MTDYTVGSSGEDYSTLAEVRGALAGMLSGDKVLFNAGETFAGYMSATKADITFGKNGAGDSPIIDSSDAGTVSCFFISASDIAVEDINLIGAAPGRRCIDITGTASGTTLERLHCDGRRQGVRSATGLQQGSTAGLLSILNCEFVGTTDGLDLDGGVVTIVNTDVRDGDNDGIITNDCTVTMLNVDIQNYANNGLSAASGSVVTAILCKANNNGIDGFQANLTSNVTAIGCTANTNGSNVSHSGDGFTAHATAVLKLHGCSASKNWKSGFKCVENSSGELINCSFYDNYNDTFSGDNFGISFDNVSGNWLCRNNITQGHRLEIQITAAAIAGTGVFTIDNNIYNNTREENAYEYNGVSGTLATFNAVVGDTASIEADPLFADAESLVLEIGKESPAVGAALNQPGADAWTIGADGMPFSNVNRDIGGIQSTHSPTHPLNT